MHVVVNLITSLKEYYIECGSEANLFSLYMNFAF